MPTIEQTDGLAGFDVLLPRGGDEVAGQRFRPSDPVEAAEEQAIPSGLRGGVSEDIADLEPAKAFRTGVAADTVTAVDVGVVRLGNTREGVVGALRGAAITHEPGAGTALRLYRGGVFHLGMENRLEVFHAMGRNLGRPDFYVNLDDDGDATSEKVALGPNDHRLLDRARNYVERLIQMRELRRQVGGILAIDGALTVRTYDTPGVFMRRLESEAESSDVSLVAVSKQTSLTMCGRDIRLMLDGDEGAPSRRKLTPAMPPPGGMPGERRSLGDLYVARFAPGGETYRVDVDPAPGLTSADAFDAFFAGSLFRNGYPEPLLQAHLFSFMPPPVVASLQAWAAGHFGLTMQREARMRPIFAPFGGRYR